MNASRSQLVGPSPTTVRSSVARFFATVTRHLPLVGAMLRRQLAARYRGSALGFVWTFLNPLLLMAVYALVFRYYMRIPVENYALFLLAGLLPWSWFAQALSEGTGSVLGGGALVTKSLFPAEILPVVVVLNHMVNFLLSLPLLVGAGLLYGVAPDPLLWLLLPVVVALQLAVTLGLTLALAALNVPYRDVQHVLGNALLLWFFSTPILYPISQAPEFLRPFLRLNPMAIFAELYQDLFFAKVWPDPSDLGVLLLVAIASLAAGIRVFEAHRDSFAELL